MQLNRSALFLGLLWLALECAVSTKVKPDCTSPPETGMCRAYFPRWYYDPKCGTCKKFVWGGCGGNGNNYETLEQCLKMCLPACTTNTTHRPTECTCKTTTKKCKWWQFCKGKKQKPKEQPAKEHPPKGKQCEVIYVC